MSSDVQEQQDEEREALQAIYEGDLAFKQINLTTFQYKYGEDDNIKSFLLELLWGENYPNEPPTINLAMFYNRNLIDKVKLKIESIINEEAQQWLGCGMTYTLFECLKDHIDEILLEQPEQATTSTISADVTNISDENKNTTNILYLKHLSKKVQLTKSQKRRQWEQSDHKGEKPRGHDWIDVVSHLSQTGFQIQIVWE